MTCDAIKKSINKGQPASKYNIRRLQTFTLSPQPQAIDTLENSGRYFGKNVLQAEILDADRPGSQRIQCSSCSPRNVLLASTVCSWDGTLSHLDKLLWFVGVRCGRMFLLCGCLLPFFLCVRMNGHISACSSSVWMFTCGLNSSANSRR